MTPWGEVDVLMSLCHEAEVGMRSERSVGELSRATGGSYTAATPYRTKRNTNP